MTRIFVTVADSAAHARQLLLAATPPNSSFTQKRNFSAEQIDRALRLGFRKPEWVWVARDADRPGAVLGLVAGWGAEARAAPFVLDFLDLPLDRPDIARAILDRAVTDSREPGRATVEIIHFLPSTSATRDAPVATLVGVLAASGFRMLVRRHRYRLDVLAGGITIPATQLRFHPLDGPDDPRLVAVISEILVRSLDAHDVDALRRADLRSVARETAKEYLELDSLDSIFLASDPSGAVVGLVIGGLRGPLGYGTASFVGVSHRYRGRGYAAQLLGAITKRMIADGAVFIIGETDDDNFPMTAAFAKVGYPHNESRIDFVRDLL